MQPLLKKAGESVAQQVEHIPFKDGVLGSSPSWFTQAEVARSLLFCLVEVQAVQKDKKMNIPLTYHRRETTTIQVGHLTIGSSAPIRVQTMANTSTNDIESSVAQALRCEKAGAELFRFTTQGAREVESLAQIEKQLHAAGSTLPLVADIHFRSDVADLAAAVCEKVRINPGNYAPDSQSVNERFSHLLDLCRQNQTAIRIGVNHGSLSARIMEQYGDTPEGMVASCMEFLRIANLKRFTNIVLSIKASNTRIMVETVRLLVATMDKENMHYPIHLGVTEAGEGEDGRIKSAVGIGALLAEGIGDTIRVSLSEEPEAEIPVAKELIHYFVDSDSPRYNENIIITYDEEKNSLFYYNTEKDWNQFQLHAAAECGRLLWQYNCDKLELLNPTFDLARVENLSKDILQAARIKMYKTEFTSCPGCGRTMFDLQTTIAQVKHGIMSRLGAKAQGLKIAIMGCIVNGPGEMADADYGYVGAGRDRISLYKGKECILKNIPQEEAVEQLVQLINNDCA